LRARIALFSLSLLVACGDPLADGAYLGEPLVTLRGRTVGDAGTSSISHPYIAIVWFNIESEVPRTIQMLAPIEAVPLSSDFTLRLWDAPPRQALGALCDGTVFTIGFAIAVDDVDDDGKVSIDIETGGLRAPDLAFGMASRNVIVYLDRVGSKTCFGMPLDFFDFGDGSSFYVSGIDECSFTSPEADGVLNVELFPPANKLPETEEVICGDPPAGT